MKKVGFIYDEIFQWHKTPAWHPETSDRLVYIVNALKDSNLWNEMIHIKPRLAGYDDIARVHTISYIEKIKTFGIGYLDGDTYMSERSLEAALYSAGAVIEAVERCKSGEIQRAFCAVRPPGHHAGANNAMGFCIFNNIAVGARYAQKIGYKKVFIVDFDVHHGNGTQHIFEEDDTIFFFSTHQYPHYPGTGTIEEKGRNKGIGYTFNVPMAAGSNDKDYLHIYQNTLPELIKHFNPDIILVSAGYDIRSEDPLSSISISDKGIRGIINGILSCSTNPVIFTLEGGYDLKSLGESIKITCEEMTES